MNENVKPGPGGWADIEVHIKPEFAGRASHKRRARIIGPLAVHKDSGGVNWTVTHLRSGGRLQHWFGSMAPAIRYARLILEELDGLNWDVADPARIAERLRGVTSRERLKELAAKADPDEADFW